MTQIHGLLLTVFCLPFLAYCFLLAASYSLPLADRDRFTLSQDVNDIYYRLVLYCLFQPVF